MLVASRALLHFLGRRHLSSSSQNQASPRVERLTGRSLIRVSGPEVSSFIQGLITNDVRHLDPGHPSDTHPRAMYCMFLNTKGRVICDSLIYVPAQPHTVLVECDSEILPSLQKHLKLFRVRRKIDIADASDELGIWVAYGGDPAESQDNDILCVRDPRLKDLGHRIIAPSSCDVADKIKASPGQEYRELRYRLGVGEGVRDLPSGNCFPLEANCDYLHGVSFHKGCYIGQELTARTHHTGIIRKRLMPIKVSPGFTSPGPDFAITLGADAKPVGKLRGLSSNSGFGLALLRVAEVLKDLEGLKIGTENASTQRPLWWPTEAPKDKQPTSQI